ncbi:uncharacterized protein B0I36DRAFT_349616 [Microdochium trichocladiopsis]|uniref:Uncharacterized protein n=1 Tax=Microdochium trichocladiopsis TaxID=1682393 RepID=A0A9P8Y759_9PEZI|nr:uncharacterized protein B0I36DRAFT_349616 [Microdochium trichocladiopsis]KAH7031556.1 hypothetical protein B0I36DRAFT_349616 [Microdochium trichocladiopsis]
MHRSVAQHILLTVAALTPGLRAQEPEWQNVSSTYNYTDFNANPDAYGIVTIPGFRLSTPYPGLADGGPRTTLWELETRVKEYMPNDDTPVSYTQISAQIRPPPPNQPGSVMDLETGNWTVPDDIADTWQVTVITFPPAFRVVVPNANDDWKGSCPLSVMSEQCVSELRENILSNPQVLAGNALVDDIMPTSGSCCHICRTQMHVTHGAYEDQSVAMNNDFNKSTIFVHNHFYPNSSTGSSSGNGGGTPSSGPSSSRTELTPYDYIGTKTVPYIVIWGYSNSTEYVGQRLNDDHVTIGCVKADTAAPGKSLPSIPAEPSGSTRTGRDVAGMLAVTGFAILISLL